MSLFFTVTHRACTLFYYSFICLFVALSSSYGYTETSSRGTVFELNIDDDTIAQSLLTLAHQTQHNLVFFNNPETQKPAPPLVGPFTLTEALSILLAHTTLNYAVVGNEIKIKPSHIDILPRVTVHSYLQSDLANIQLDNDGLSDYPHHHLPLSIQSANEDYFDMIESKDMAEIIAYLSGIEYFEPFFGAHPQFYSRGQQTPIGIDGKLHRRTSLLLDKSVVERVDIIQGPSFNYLAPGGLINIVLKKPTFDNTLTVKASAGSYDYYRAEMDLNFSPSSTAKTPGASSNDSGTFGGRAILSVEDQKGIKPFDYRQTQVAATSLKFTGKHDDMLNVQLYYQREDEYPETLTLHEDILGTQLPRDRTLGLPWAEATYVDQFLSADYARPFADNLDVTFGLNWRNSETATWLTNMTNLQNNNGDILPSIIFYEGIKDIFYGVDAAIEYAHTIHGKEMLTRISSDYQHYLQHSPNYGIQSTTELFNAFSPNYTIAQPQKPEQIGEYTLTGDVYALALSNNLYLTNDVTLYGDIRYEIMRFGGRFADANFGIEWYPSGKYEELTAQLGANKAFNTTLSAHLSYTESFSHQPIPDATMVSNAFNANAEFVDPIENHQWELSLKKQWLNARLSSNITAYHLVRSNIQTFNINESFVVINEHARDQKSRGVTISAIGRATNNFWLVANASYNDSYITTETPQALSVYFFTSPSDRNYRLRNTAMKTANLWLHVDHLPGIFEHVEFGIGVQHFGKRYADDINRFPMESYNVIDTVLRYTGMKHLELSLNIKNLNDRRYYVSGLGDAIQLGDAPQIEEGAPRSIFLNLKSDINF